MKIEKFEYITDKDSELLSNIIQSCTKLDDDGVDLEKTGNKFIAIQFSCLVIMGKVIEEITEDKEVASVFIKDLINNISLAHNSLIKLLNSKEFKEQGMSLISPKDK